MGVVRDSAGGRTRADAAPGRARPGRNLTYDLLEQLGQAIVTGEYGQANPFPTEAEISRQYATSRSITREAVKMLTTKGLLRARPRQGTFVEPEESWNLLDPDVLRWHLERKFSLKLLMDFTEVRLAVEPQAAALAARRADMAAIAGIRRAVERMYAAERGEDDVLAADIAFHVATLRASGNCFFMNLEDLINTALHISIRFTNRMKGVRLASVQAHEAVMQAIVAGDAPQASAGMRLMLLEAMELFEAAQGSAAVLKKRSKKPVSAVADLS
jgi:DNA-binding FadR family transcriptional regulator